MTILDTFKTRIQAADRIVITTHEFPDADGIGSEISLCLALRSLGKKVYCVNEEPLLDRYQYLDQDKVVQGFDDYMQSHADFKPELIIVVDTNTKDRVGKRMCQFIGEETVTLYIDHHPCRGRDLSTHCIDVKAAATGQMVGEMIEALGIKFTKKMALPIYTSIIINWKGHLDIQQFLLLLIESWQNSWTLELIHLKPTTEFMEQNVSFICTFWPKS